MLSEGNKNGEVSEPSTAAVTEAEPDSESSMAQQPASGAEPESSDSRMEEVPMPLPLSLLVPAEYYYHQHHQQHLFHFSYSFYNSRPAMPKCVDGTRVRPRVCNPAALSKARRLGSSVAS